MIKINGKKLLVLGGGSASVNVVKYAREMGVKTYVVDYLDGGEAKKLGDEQAVISTIDYDALAAYMKENDIDGVMTGASEFNIVNTMRLCKKTGKPFYATEEQWNICQNKQNFKQLCRDYGVPCVPEYDQEHPESFCYPVIVKPTDGCSARGISVCENREEYEAAKEKALAYSNEKKLIVEKFIQNGGTTMSVRYIVREGKLFLHAVGDRYVLDDTKGKALITAAAFYPSKHTDYYIKHVDEKVKRMFEGIGLKNGALFMESCFADGEVWFYEMGLRISGGMTYLITEKTNDVNELKMLICHAVTGSMCEEADVKKINPYLNGYYTASLCIPLSEGTISEIKGVEEIKATPCVNTFTQYWHEGETIEARHIGTLDQLFARVSVIVKNKEDLTEVIDKIIDTISIRDTEGKEMFITSKLKDIYNDYIS